MVANRDEVSEEGGRGRRGHNDTGRRQEGHRRKVPRMKTFRRRSPNRMDSVWHVCLVFRRLDNPMHKRIYVARKYGQNRYEKGAVGIT